MKAAFRFSSITKWCVCTALITAPTWLNEYANCVDRELSKMYLDPPGSPGGKITELHRAAMDALASGGKRVRGILALLWCESISGDYKRALPVALAYELAHASALIQDDIVDNSSLRRGEKSTVAKYGLANAILASDLLLFQVPKMISLYKNLSSERLCKLFDLVGDSCRATTWGEFLDLEMASGELESNKEISSEEMYEDMIRMKTASLLRAPAASGAIVGGASEEETSLAYKFGEYLGMAYQIQDDLLDLMADEDVLGKPTFTDMRSGKRNAVLFYSLNHSTTEDADFIRSLLGRDASYYSESEIKRARDIFEESGAVSYAEEKAEGYVKAAKRLLGDHEVSIRNNRLLELSDYLSKRYY